MASCIRTAWLYGRSYEITDYPAECRQTAATGAVILLDRCWTPSEGGTECVRATLYLSGGIVGEGRDTHYAHSLHARVSCSDHHLIARGSEIVGAIIHAVSCDDVRGLEHYVTPECHTDAPGMAAVYI